MLLFGPPQRPRQFAYKPRFYTPPEESEEEEKRIRFEGRFVKRVRSAQRQKKSLIGMLLLLIIVVYLFFYLEGMVKQEQRYRGPIKVEDIEVIEVPAQQQ